VNTKTQPKATLTATVVEHPKAAPAAEPKAKRKYKKRALPATTMSARIRTLTELGHKPKEIVALLGCEAQQVYNVQYKDRQDKLIKQVKRAVAEQQQHVENLREAKELLSQPPVVTAVPKLTIAQRLRVLFTGRYA
jgi:histone acetyltransferase (RNA polymerase elongator complex component)